MVYFTIISITILDIKPLTNSNYYLTLNVFLEEKIGMVTLACFENIVFGYLLTVEIL